MQNYVAFIIDATSARMARRNLKRQEQVISLPALRRRNALRIDFSGINASEGFLNIIRQLESLYSMGLYGQEVKLSRMSRTLISNCDKLA